MTIARRIAALISLLALAGGSGVQAGSIRLGTAGGTPGDWIDIPVKLEVAIGFDVIEFDVSISLDPTFFTEVDLSGCGGVFGVTCSFLDDVVRLQGSQDIDSSESLGIISARLTDLPMPQQLISVPVTAESYLCKDFLISGFPCPDANSRVGEVLFTPGQDEFEPDNGALDAYFPAYNPFTGALVEDFLEQYRTMHLPLNSDWMAVRSGDEGSIMFSVEHSDDSDLAINMQILDAEPFLSLGLFIPLYSFNSCPSAVTAQEFAFELDTEEARTFLFRFRNCFGTTQGFYKLTFDSVFSSFRIDPSVIKGTISRFGGLSLPLFVQSNLNDTTFSDPQTGNYQLAVTSNQATSVNVFSPLFAPVSAMFDNDILFEPGPVLIFPVDGAFDIGTPTGGSMLLDILVQAPDLIHADSFED